MPPNRLKTSKQFSKKQLVLLSISLILLILLASLVEWQEIWDAFLRAKPIPLVTAVLLTLLFPLFNQLRWLAVLWALNVPMSFERSFRITMACWPVGTLTPGKAGEIIKANAVADRQVGLGSVIAERVIDVGVLGAFGTIFGLMFWHRWAIAGGLFGLGGAAGVVLFASWAEKLLSGRKIGEKLHGFLSVSPKLARRPRFLLACVLASGMNWFLSMAQLAFLLEAFGSSAPLPLIMAILPAATFVGLLPISLAGIGTRDAALLFLSRGLVDPAALLASSIVYTFLGYFFLGTLGLPFLNALVDREGETKSDSRKGSPFQ